MTTEKTHTDVTICEWCAGQVAVGTNQCPSCGGPVSVIAPLHVECGWCDFSNRRDQTAICTNCGGRLPSIPGGDPGPPPPAVPRVLPRGYRSRIMLKKNVLVIIGMMFTVFFFWTIIFPIIGIPLWIVGRRKGLRRLDALINGVPTRGRLAEIRIDYNTTINNKHPWAIEFEYDTPQGLQEGIAQAWDPCHGRRQPGEHIWVVYIPDAPHTCAIWPPIR